VIQVLAPLNPITTFQIEWKGMREKNRASYQLENEHGMGNNEWREVFG